MDTIKRNLVGLIIIAGLIWGINSFAIAQEVRSPESLTKLVQGAKQEGKFTLYHSPNFPDIKLILDGFHRKYPFMKADNYRAGSVALINRVVTEHRAKVNKWDVLILNSLFMQQLKKEGILQKYVTREAAAYGKGFRDEGGYWNGLFVNAQVLGYNTRMVKSKDVPVSFMDLLEPKWKGQIAIDAEPYEWLICLEKEWGREKTWDFVKKLCRQKLTRRRGRSLLCQLLAAGEFPVAIPLYSYKIEQMKSEGAPLEWVAPDPVSANMLGIALAEKPKKPNAAKLFIEFALSREGQQIVRNFKRIPARLEVKPSPARLTEGVRLVPSDPTVADEINRVLEEFEANFRK